MNVSHYFLIALMLATTTAQGSDFSIEDTDLKPVPSTIEHIIRQTKEVDAKCKFIGKAINLSGLGKKSDFFATTANACDWGAAAGPIWLLRNNEIVLRTGASSIKLKPPKNNELLSIQSSIDSAGSSTIEIWSFIGKKYQKTQSYIFTTDDEKTCKAHKDICPFEF